LPVLGFASSPVGLWPGVVMLGTGVGIAQTVTTSHAAEIGGEIGQGKVSGLTMTMMPIGVILRVRRRLGCSAGGSAGGVLPVRARFPRAVRVAMAAAGRNHLIPMGSE
jgi:hypothetical protein